jgi:hypothetical protein
MLNSARFPSIASVMSLAGLVLGHSVHGGGELARQSKGTCTAAATFFQQQRLQTRWTPIGRHRTILTAYPSILNRGAKEGVMDSNETSAGGFVTLDLDGLWSEERRIPQATYKPRMGPRPWKRKH